MTNMELGPSTIAGAGPVMVVISPYTPAKGET